MFTRCKLISGSHSMKKLYYSISEVSKLVDEEQHILRYWEKEFPGLKPKKNRAGNRTYSEKDIQFILLVKKLLREDKISLKEAKDKVPEMMLSGNTSEELFSEVTAIEQKSNNLQNEPVNNNIGKSGNTHKDSSNENKDVIYILKDVLSLLKEL
jgi:DNA-binding transcriptional MerR regulator